MILDFIYNNPVLIIYLSVVIVLSIWSFVASREHMETVPTPNTPNLITSLTNIVKGITSETSSESKAEIKPPTPEINVSNFAGEDKKVCFKYTKTIGANNTDYYLSIQQKSACSGLAPERECFAGVAVLSPLQDDSAKFTILKGFPEKDPEGDTVYRIRTVGSSPSLYLSRYLSNLFGKTELCFGAPTANVKETNNLLNVTMDVVGKNVILSMKQRNDKSMVDKIFYIGECTSTCVKAGGGAETRVCLTEDRMKAIQFVPMLVDINAIQ